MATFVTETLYRIDDAVLGYAGTTYSTIAGPLATTVQLAGVLSLGLLAANTLLQWTPIRVSQFITWGIRYVIVASVVTSWAQFEPIYDILTNVPAEIGNTLITGGDAGTLNTALDELITDVFAISDKINDEAGTFDFGMAITAVLIYLLGAAMACVAIVVSAIAKVGLAFAVGVAPLFVATMMFRGTSQLFESWCKFTLGFAMIPIVLAGAIGATIGVAQDLARDPDTVSELSEITGTIIVLLAAIFMMKSVPTMVNGLAGTIVATASGIGEFRDAATAAAGPTAMAAGAAASQARQTVGAAGAAAHAARQGGSFQDMRRAIRQQREEMFAESRRKSDAWLASMRQRGHEPSVGERMEARRAATHDTLREQRLARIRERQKTPPAPRAGELAKPAATLPAPRGNAPKGS